MHTINVIFQDITKVSCDKVFIEVYNNHDIMVKTGNIKTINILPYLQNRPFNLNNTGNGIQFDAILPIQDYIGEEIINLIK